MFSYPNVFLPSKKTRDFSISDTEIALSNARLLAVAARTPVLAPDTLVKLSGVSPETVIAVETGAPISGTDTLMGVTTTYSSNTALVAGVVGVAKLIPGMSFRVKSAKAMADQAAIDAIIGLRYFLTTTTDADGFDHQVLDTNTIQATSLIKVVDGDYTTDTLLVEISTP